MVEGSDDLPGDTKVSGMSHREDSLATTTFEPSADFDFSESRVFQDDLDGGGIPASSLLDWDTDALFPWKQEEPEATGRRFEHSDLPLEPLPFSAPPANNSLVRAGREGLGQACNPVHSSTAETAPPWASAARLDFGLPVTFPNPSDAYPEAAVPTTHAPGPEVLPRGGDVRGLGCRLPSFSELLSEHDISQALGRPAELRPPPSVFGDPVGRARASLHDPYSPEATPQRQMENLTARVRQLERELAHQKLRIARAQEESSHLMRRMTSLHRPHTLHAQTAVRAAANLEKCAARLASLEEAPLPPHVEEEVRRCLSRLRDSLCGIFTLGNSPPGGTQPPDLRNRHAC